MVTLVPCCSSRHRSIPSMTRASSPRLHSVPICTGAPLCTFPRRMPYAVLCPASCQSLPCMLRRQADSIAAADSSGRRRGAPIHYYSADSDWAAEDFSPAPPFVPATHTQPHFAPFGGPPRGGLPFGAPPLSPPSDLPPAPPPDLPPPPPPDSEGFDLGPPFRALPRVPGT